MKKQRLEDNPFLEIQPVLLLQLLGVRSYISKQRGGGGTPFTPKTLTQTRHVSETQQSHFLDSYEGNKN